MIVFNIILFIPDLNILLKPRKIRIRRQVGIVLVDLYLGLI